MAVSSELQKVSTVLTPPSGETLDALVRLQDDKLQEPQLELHTEHTLHGGMYIRTIRLRAGVDMIGSLINLPTVLIVSGRCSMLAGDERVELEGYNVLPGCAGRKQLFTTYSAVEMTMIYPTEANTVEEAENEIFGEADMLMSRRNSSGDTVNITGQ